VRKAARNRKVVPASPASQRVSVGLDSKRRRVWVSFEVEEPAIYWSGSTPARLRIISARLVMLLEPSKVMVPWKVEGR
jgi:hypothetical protein